MTKTQQTWTLSIEKTDLGNRSQLHKLSIDYESRVNVSAVTYVGGKEAEYGRAH